MGIGTALACTGCLGACTSKSDPAPTNVDFTLDLSQSANAALQNPGGFISANGVIVARISTTEFTALSRACTHQGTPVNFVASNQTFNCPNHNSNFSKDGSVLNGPASSPLRKYQTSLNGNSLRVFS
ncbi:MAG: Rieske (2Fe-2S) protein [Cyclobacteriaceae bacterium]|nr:Rieske (2Fe-2S) protein [Cyclobacteriaceae bacterium]